MIKLNLLFHAKSASTMSEKENHKRRYLEWRIKSIFLGVDRRKIQAENCVFKTLWSMLDLIEALDGTIQYL